MIHKLQGIIHWMDQWKQTKIQNKLRTATWNIRGLTWKESELKQEQKP
jgi:hypothetical protein